MGSISLIFAALAAAATSPRQSHRELKLTSRVDHAPPEESLSYWRYVVDDGLENPEALAAADLDGDGQITGGDLGVLLSSWGVCE